MPQDNGVKTLVYIVHYRMSRSEPQGFQKFYTKAAAEDFQLTVELLGGISMIEEDLEDGI
jgi:hypothetical protein